MTALALFHKEKLISWVQAFLAIDGRKKEAERRFDIFIKTLKLSKEVQKNHIVFPAPSDLANNEELTLEEKKILRKDLDRAKLLANEIYPMSYTKFDRKSKQTEIL